MDVITCPCWGKQITRVHLELIIHMQFQDNSDNTISADDLAPYVARSPASTALNMMKKLFLVFHKEDIQLPAPSQRWEFVS